MRLVLPAGDGAALPRLASVGLLAACAAFAGIGAAGGASFVLAAAVVLAPVLILVVARPWIPLAVAVTLLPFAFSLVGASSPVRVAPSDLLITFAVVGALMSGRYRLADALAPLAPLLLVYVGVLVVAVAANPDVSAFINSVQRVQLTVVSLAVGVFIVRSGQLQRALKGFVVAASILSVLWATDLIPASLQLQKNPVGQFAADGVLVVLAIRGGKARFLALPALLLGLLSTASRGAIIGLFVGVIVLVLTRPGTTRLRTAGYLVPVALLFAGFYSTLPADVQARTTTFSAAAEGAGTSGQYTIRIREIYNRDARHIIATNPVTGVGIGNYLAGSKLDGSYTNDPHDFVLLEAAEGGLPLAGALLLLLAGSAVLVWRRRAEGEVGPLALALQAALVTHGLLDVYWVRGTPVIGWVLVGAVLAGVSSSSSAPAERAYDGVLAAGHA